MSIVSPGSGGPTIRDTIILRMKYARGIICRAWAGDSQVVLGYVGEEVVV
jgi:hypothetical protein